MTETQQYGLDRVHRANLAVLTEVDRICRKYKIRYLLDAGTLLGAVRHKGFIPWDDDADLAFTREQYEMFRKVVRRELPEGMTFLDPWELRGGKAFFDFTPRIIYDRSSTRKVTEETAFYEEKLNHLYVDIFILDKLPAGKTARMWTLFLQTVVYGLSMGHRFRLDFKKYGLIGKIGVGALALTGKMIPMNFLFRLQRRIAVKDGKGRGRSRYYSNYQPDYLYVTLEKEWCEETVDLEFEGKLFMAPKGYHQVLTWVYGDYRQLPPPDQRVPTHSDKEILVYD